MNWGGINDVPSGRFKAGDLVRVKYAPEWGEARVCRGMVCGITGQIAVQFPGMMTESWFNPGNLEAADHIRKKGTS